MRVSLLVLCAVFLGSCGQSRQPNFNNSTTAATARSGMGLLRGTAVVITGTCNNLPVISISVTNLGNTLVYSSDIAANSAYRVDLNPGQYVITARALPCSFSQNFDIGADRVVTVDLLLR